MRELQEELAISRNPKVFFPPDSFIFFLSLNLNFPTPELTIEQRWNVQAQPVGFLDTAGGNSMERYAMF